jgi:hypothetical protein
VIPAKKADNKAQGIQLMSESLLDGNGTVKPALTTDRLGDGR